MHIQVNFDQIPVRAWRLVVDGNQIQSDLHVLRLKNESLLYFEADESYHEVDIPWGRGEVISIVLTAGRHGGSYTVTFLGPPREAVVASYSYRVNRALEAYAVGKRIEAEELCQEALQEDPTDGAARVMLAGFLRDRHFYERAATLIAEALAQELPDDMRELALQLSEELDRLQAPLSPTVRAGLEAAENQLAAGDPAATVATCDGLLTGTEDLSTEARSLILQSRARALHQLGRHFEAVDTYTRALTVTRSREDQAVIYFYMAQLFVDMGNVTQAEGAFNIARQYGLPPGLELQAAEAVRQITSGRQ
jgi:tetratricopeptide (TPR) repeat protein